MDWKYSQSLRMHFNDIEQIVTVNTAGIVDPSLNLILFYDTLEGTGCKGEDTEFLYVEMHSNISPAEVPDVDQVCPTSLSMILLPHWTDHQANLKHKTGK